MASIEGSREIEAAKKRLVAAIAAEESARKMFEMAKQNADASAKEVQEARKGLKDAEAKWDVVPIDSDGDESESESEKQKGKRFCDNGDWGTYDGELDAEGFRHGKGKMSWDDGDVYNGQWKEDMAEGKGTFWWASGVFAGNVYEGQYKNSKREGEGTYQWADGEKYVGGFKGDELSGRGTYYFNNGEVYMGQYEYDEPFGEGVRWSKDRQTAWFTQDGSKKRKISPEKGKKMATKMGFGGVPPALEE